MPRRALICVDTESNGLDLDRHQAIEVSWHNMDTDETGWFIPVHDVNEVLRDGEPEAFRINGYLERIAHLPQDVHYLETGRLAQQLSGNTLAGSNPAFDAIMLRKLFRGQTYHHHRMLDLSCLAAGVLGIDDLLRLDKLCKLLRVGAYPDHTAAGDVRVTIACFRRLWEIRAQMPQMEAR